eukprot:gene27014-2240_t
MRQIGNAQRQASYEQQRGISRRQSIQGVALTTLLWAQANPQAAQAALAQFPADQLKNQYYLIRAGGSVQRIPKDLIGSCLSDQSWLQSVQRSPTLNQICAPDQSWSELVRTMLKRLGL